MQTAALNGRALGRGARRAAWKAAALYVVGAAAWILLSDSVAESLSRSPAELVHLQTVKGLLFVAVTGALVFAVVVRGRLVVAGVEGRYHALMENMASSVLVYRPVDGGRDFEIVDLNPAARRVGRVEEKDILGRRVTEVWPGVERAGVLTALRRVHRSGNPEHLADFHYGDGRVEGWWDLHLSALPGGELVAVFEDITERHQALDALHRGREELEERVAERTAELSAANERLQELDRLKSLFIATMSHELRTPLNSIIGFTGVLLQEMAGPVNAKQRDYLNRVYGAGEHLLALVTDVIDISKIEAGAMPAYPSDFELTRVVDEAMAAVGPRAAGTGVALANRTPGGLRLHTDRRRLLQCLTNLVGNAVKYSDGGHVTVDAKVEDEGRLALAVRDEGIGIPESDQKRLFQPFVRLDDPHRRRPGTGLGLYLTRKIATEILEGDVSVSSREGAGSTFTLHIPTELAS